MSTHTPVYRYTEYLPVQLGNSHPISHCVQCPLVLSQISPVSQCPHIHQSTDTRNTYLFTLVTPILFHTVYNVLLFYHRSLQSHNVHTYTSLQIHEYLKPVQLGNSHPISHCIQCPLVLSQTSPVSQCPHIHQSTDARNTYLYSLVTPILFHTLYNVL